MARVIHGTVSYVSPDIDESNQTIQVQARVVGCVDCVPGLRVSVAHVIAPHRRILAVPGLSLVPSLTGYSVYQVRNNRVVPVTVDTGERFGSWVVISKGLKVGDRIITAGLQAVSAGNLVRVV